MPRRTHNRRHAAIVPILLAATTVASCVTARESSPVQESGSALPSIAASASPSVTPLPTPPAQGEPWGGLVFSEPLVQQMVGDWPPRTVSWGGRAFGMAPTTAADGSHVFRLVSSADGVRWAPVAGGGIQAQNVQVAGNDAAIVAVEGLGSLYDCKIGSDEFEHCSTRPLKAWFSADGSSWPESSGLPSSGNGSLTGLAAGPAGFVAVGIVGGDPAIWFSTTGSAWERVSSAALAGASLENVTAVPGGFVATGGFGRDKPSGWCGLGCWEGGQAAAWWSADGRAWSRAVVELPTGLTNSIRDVYLLRGGLVALGLLISGGDNGAGYRWAAWTSTDGRSWRYVAIDTTDEDARPSFAPEAPMMTWGVIAGDGDRLLSLTKPHPYAVEDGDHQPLSEVWESFDGITWHQLRVEGFAGALGLLDSQSWSAGVAFESGGIVATWAEGDQVTRLRAVAVP